MVKKAIPEIPWELIIPELVKVATPFIQAIAWLGLSRIDPKVNAMNNLVAIAEVVPAIDLNLPRGIVLAAMYDKTGDALEMINQVTQAILDLPSELKEFVQTIVDETKEEIEDIIPDLPDLPDLPEVEVERRKKGETWQQFLERRLKETGFGFGF